jgi:hypothetical protein
MEGHPAENAPISLASVVPHHGGKEGIATGTPASHELQTLSPNTPRILLRGVPSMLDV